MSALTQEVLKEQIGKEFELAGMKWKVLNITAAGYMCLGETLEDDMIFDRAANNWADSALRKYLNTTVFEKLAQAVGEENIIPFTRDLLSLDGLDEYGTCEDKVSLISFDEYRKYRKLIPNAGYWWWTITPDSTKGNGYSNWTTVVCPSGVIRNDGCSCRDGVRPLCIFSSSIFESTEKMNGNE